MSHRTLSEYWTYLKATIAKHYHVFIPEGYANAQETPLC